MRVQLRGAGMDPWGVCDQVMFIGEQPEECESKLSSSVPKEEDPQDKEETIKAEPIFMPKFKKRKRLSLDRLKEMKADLCGGQSSSKPKKKKNESKDRWTNERYKLAEQSMWEVLKEEGATFESPISRPALRMTARKHIGDTGLLDHLLKHIDGKVAPGGTERFRRWFNPSGIMEYWLENANLEKVRQEAGQGPYWIPPSANNVPSQNSDSTDELKMLQTEMAQMKKDMQELKKQEKSEMISMEETQKGFIKWKAEIEQRLAEIMTSFKGVQGMHHDMVIWKTKVERQLVEITNKLNHVRASTSTEHITNPPPVRWEDWLQSNSVDNNIQGNEIVPWFGSPELLNIPQEVVGLQYPNLTIPTQPHCEEMANKKSGLLELGSGSGMLKEDQPNVTPESSTSVNSKSELDNSFTFIQEKIMEFFTWKEKMELQLLDISNSVYEILSRK